LGRLEINTFDEKRLVVLLGRFSSRKGLSRASKLLVCFFVALVLVILDFFEISSVTALKCYLSANVMTIKCIINSLAETPKLISEYIDVKNENKKLRLELDELKIKTIVVSGIEKEIEELKKIVNLRYSSNLYRTMEKVLGFDRSMYDSFILISVTQKETNEGAIVISSDGLVGFVFDLNGTVARVLPITNQKMAIPVKTANGEHMIIAGTDKNELISKEIQDNAISNLKVGDMLMTSGEGGVFIANIPVANITKVDRKTGEVHAIPVTQVKKLSFVWIINSVIWK
jgi:rod shape-determining protein MreC